MNIHSGWVPGKFMFICLCPLRTGLQRPHGSVNEAARTLATQAQAHSGRPPQFISGTGSNGRPWRTRAVPGQSRA